VSAYILASYTLIRFLFAESLVDSGHDANVGRVKMCAFSKYNPIHIAITYLCRINVDIKYLPGFKFPVSLHCRYKFVTYS
jgi:hypothetical protein